MDNVWVVMFRRDDGGEDLAAGVCKTEHGAKSHLKACEKEAEELGFAGDEHYWIDEAQFLDI